MIRSLVYQQAHEQWSNNEAFLLIFFPMSMIYAQFRLFAANAFLAMIGLIARKYGPIYSFILIIDLYKQVQY